MFMKTPIKKQADKKKGQGTLCKGQGVTEEGQGAIQRRQGARHLAILPYIKQY
jgi:hypothetical protein